MIIQRKFNKAILEDAGCDPEDIGELWEDIVVEDFNCNVLAHLIRRGDPIGTEYRIIEGTSYQTAKVFAKEQPAPEVRYYSDHSA